MPVGLISEHSSHFELQNGSQYRPLKPTHQEYSDRQTPRGMAAYLPTGPQPISPARPQSSSVIDVGLNCTDRF